MEAIAVFGLACNIISVIDFSFTAAKLLRQIYQQGSSQENLDLDDITTDLLRSISALEKLLKNSHNASLRNEVESQLQSLASQCMQSAKELSQELQYLRSKGGRLSAVKMMMVSLAKKGRLERLIKKLDQYQTLLNTGLLISLRDQFDTASVIQQTGFEKLDATLKNFVQALDKGTTRVEDLIKAEHASLQRATQKENAETRAHMTTELENMRLESIATVQTKQLVDSLRYSEIYARQNQISAPQGDTFGWIYDRNQKGPWWNFSDWLESGKELFWIQGKPGSGKSCLMNFIFMDVRTKLHLLQWKPNRQPRILSFFFWLVGSSLQNGLHGFACSLLHQLLENDQECVNHLIMTRPDLQRKRHTWDWHTQEVLNVLLDLVQMQSAQTPFLFLIDGLDEFNQNDDFELLGKTLLTLDANSHVKLCVSSRPETHIAHILSRKPSLRLQDLTAADIKHYVSKQLKDFESSQAPRSRMSNKEHDDLIAEFVDRADGVFLWIRLAVRDIFRGLRKGDTFEQLWSRLLKLPIEIEQLYEDMLNRMGSDLELYKQEASTYLKIACLSENLELVPGPHLQPPLTLIHYAIASSKYLRHTETYDKPVVELDNILEDIKYTRLRIVSCCNGLLEVNDNESDVGLAYVSGAKISMAHRSVRDFLLENPVGQRLLAKAPIDNFEISCALIEGEFAMFGLDNGLSAPWTLCENLQGLIWKLSSCSETNHSIAKLCMFTNKRLREYTEPSSSLETGDNGQWEFELCKKLHWRQIDFIGMVASCISFRLLQELADLTGRQMSTSYQAYLLVCLSYMCGTQYATDSTEYLLRFGAEADSEVFLPINFPIKATAWSNVFQWLQYRDDFADKNIKGYIKLLLKAGANPDQNFLAAFEVFNEVANLAPLYINWSMPEDWDTPETLLICEVNASFVLSWMGRTNLVTELDISASTPYVKPLAMWLRHPFDRDVNPFKENLTVWSPGLAMFSSKGEAVSISPPDQAILTSIITDSSWVDDKRRFSETRCMNANDTMQRIAERSEKADIREVLERHGYYKKPDDPAVFQGPIQRFAANEEDPHKQDASLPTEVRD